MEFVNCIVCNSEKNFKLVQSVPDRFNSSNLYNILECDCGMVMLNPRPNIKQISKHYDVLDYQPHHKSNGVLDILYKIGQFFNNLGSNFREKNGINFWKWLKKIVSLKK